ncbi:MAG: hypothetical protein KAT43_06085 [Nanoarchaeota archaeon]|nr:hypothetical protein [Nanoarchaeota archaeon]
MKIKNRFKFFKEPYVEEEKFWLIDIEEGDVYKIDKDVFLYLQKKKASPEIEKQLLDLRIIEDET